MGGEGRDVCGCPRNAILAEVAFVCNFARKVLCAPKGSYAALGGATDRLGDSLEAPGAF